MTAPYSGRHRASDSAGRAGGDSHATCCAVAPRTLKTRRGVNASMARQADLRAKDAHDAETFRRGAPAPLLTIDLRSDEGERTMDSPIYERLARGDRLNPLANGRRTLIVSGEVVTAPLDEAAARTMRDIERQFFHASAAALAAHGLHPYDIVAPDYRRIVYTDELTS